MARTTLAEFVKSGPTAEELEAAKRNIVDGFPLRIDSNRKIHEYLALIGFYRLPLTYLEDFVQARRARYRRRHPGRIPAARRSRPHGDGGGRRRAGQVGQCRN